MVQTQDLNVILVSLDAVRSDHLGCYGYARNTSPNIDSLAEQGVLFEQLIAASSWTIPSHTSILSGLNVLRHGTHNVKDQISTDVKLLPEILKEQGYATAGFVSVYLLSGLYGFDRGFDVYQNLEKTGDRNIKEARTADDLISGIIGWLKQNKQQKFFVFAHFFDAHVPFIPPAPFKTLFDAGYSGEVDGFMTRKCRYVWEQGQGKKSDLDHWQALYDGCIAYVDFQLGRLVDFLKQEGLFENTLIIVTADHGEQFGEHGFFGHVTYHDTELKVPLILHCPKLLPKGERRKQFVRHIDLLPTILDYLNIQSSPALDGQSLRSIMENNADPQLIAFGGTGLNSSNFFIRTERWKYFERSLIGESTFTINSGFFSSLRRFLSMPYRWQRQKFKPKMTGLFDLQADPLEQNNLINKMPDIVEQLKAKINAFKIELEQTPLNQKKIDINENDAKAVEERLQALGYID